MTCVKWKVKYKRCKARFRANFILIDPRFLQFQDYRDRKCRNPRYLGKIITVR